MHVRSKFPRLAPFVLAAGALLGGQTAQAQISVSPIIVTLAPESGIESRTIAVTNSGQMPISVRYYAGDFEQDESGENRFAHAGSFPSSCAERMRVYPDGASVLPGETQTIRVDMQPGAESCWSAVFVETAGVNLGGTMVRQRVAAKIYGVRSDARVEGEIVDVATRLGEDGRQLSLTFRNTGDAPVRPQGTVEIRSFTGEVVATTPILAFSVLPGRDRTVVLPVSGLRNAGGHVAVPVLDFGGEYLAGGQVVFDARPGEVLFAAERSSPAEAEALLQ